MAQSRYRATLQQVVSRERAPFIEMVETQVMHLHEGNIARYRLRPAEYHQWRKTWR